MRRGLRAPAAAGTLSLALIAANPALAQKPGGILKMYSPDSPASMSIHEEATVFAEGPMMGVFNNLVMFDQHVAKNSLDDEARSAAVRAEHARTPQPGRRTAPWLGPTVRLAIR